MMYHNESLRGITTKYNLETTEEASGTSANTETDCDKDERLKKMYDLLKFDNVVRRARGTRSRSGKCIRHLLGG